jgi:hypothetical protein
MDNITISPAHEGSITRMWAAFTMDDARYHVWFDARTMQLEAPILYKNPLPRTEGSGTDQKPRRLDATSVKNARLVAELMKAVTERKLVEIAIQQVHQENAQKQHLNHINAFALASWISAMRGYGNLQLPSDISNEEFKTASRKLADTLEGK